MKKSILTVIFAMAIIFSASAQEHKWFIGGEVGFWSGKQTYDFSKVLLTHYDYDLDFYPYYNVTTTQIIVAPEIGYNITDKFAVAASLGYLHTKIKEYDNKVDGFIISPYVRYTFLKSGIVSAFIDGGATFGLSDFKGFEIGINPGIAVALTNRFSAVAHLGFLGYKDGKGVGNFLNGKGFGLDLSGYQSQLGFYYSF